MYLHFLQWYHILYKKISYRDSMRINIHPLTSSWVNVKEKRNISCMLLSTNSTYFILATEKWKNEECEKRFLTILTRRIIITKIIFTLVRLPHYNIKALSLYTCISYKKFCFKIIMYSCGKKFKHSYLPCSKLS